MLIVTPLVHLRAACAPDVSSTMNRIIFSMTEKCIEMLLMFIKVEANCP